MAIGIVIWASLVCDGITLLVLINEYGPHATWSEIPWARVLPKTFLIAFTSIMMLCIVADVNWRLSKEQEIEIHE